jgi:DNA-binding transcriptional LysR family regulator
MSTPDLNLLITLDVLLAEGSVARAARRLRLSPSAMSRALARLREATGDPLLVRNGRGLTPTPRAAALRERVGHVVEEATAILRPVERLDPATLARTFTIRVSEGFVECFAPRIIARVTKEAPGVRVSFVQKADKSSAPLREGVVDLETGVVAPDTGAELLTKALFRDRLVGVTRKGHALAKGRITTARYLAAHHVCVSRRGFEREAIDDVLHAEGARRDVVTSVGGFATALGLARATDLVATVPERHTRALRVGMFGFRLPVPVPAFTVAMLWHPRLDADPAHRWLREHVHAACVD